jgi:hypothetical protein
MEQNTPKFRLRMNLFDGIVLTLALCVGAFLVWNVLRPEPVEETLLPTSTVRYVVRFNKMIEGTETLVEPGDVLIDNVKNRNMGTVISTETHPHTVRTVDEENKKLVMAEVPGYVDLFVTVESNSAVINDNCVVLDGGYTLRANTYAYIRGEGYMASGPILVIEREGQA